MGRRASQREKLNIDAIIAEAQLLLLIATGLGQPLKMVPNCVPKWTNHWIQVALGKGA